MTTPNAGMVWELFNSSQTSFVISPSGNIILTGSTSPVNLRAAGTTNFTLSYNGSSTVTLTLLQGSSSYGQTFAYNLQTTLGNPAGGLAYIGFTGGDGSTTSTQMISNFTLQSTSNWLQSTWNWLPVDTPLQISPSGTFDLNGVGQALGSLAGSGTVTSSAATLYPAPLTLGNDDSNQTFSGTITGDLALTKVGSGMETLSDVNTYSGDTLVTSGTLVLANAGSLLEGSGLTIGDSLVFDGLAEGSSEGAGGNLALDANRASVPASGSSSAVQGVESVPEPGSLALLAAAALTAGVAGWRAWSRSDCRW